MRSSMKRIIFLTVIVILFFVIVHLMTSIYTLWHKKDLLTNAKEQLQQEKLENVQLHQELVKVNSPQFLNEQARDRLLLVKPGQSEVLIDPTLLKATSSAQKTETRKPYWQQWFDLLFGN